MLEENILCIKVNGQIVYQNIKKDICIPNRENITYRKNSANIAKLNMEVVTCKEA
ncbi:hypothetical protein [Clostridium sp. HMP27]|uniref:hypothetical protein n=1 Tax=Clostridium sp. HMP27 TaxID=1487921 RepID=UPI0025BEBECE|nr:hypothetical protein [Clostridium sp. HMP27]